MEAQAGAVHADAPESRSAPGDLQAEPPPEGELAPVGARPERPEGELGAAGPGAEPAGAAAAPAASLGPAMVQMSLVDVRMDLPQAFPVVALEENDEPRRVLRFPVGLAEGTALAYALGEIATARPLTHELMAQCFEHFGIATEVVRITELVGRTLLAEVVLSHNGRHVTLPARPSDAVALALRSPLPVPIMVAEEVLAEAGDAD